MCIDKDLERGEWKDTVKCYIKPVNSCWWRQKIWNALRKWQSWGRRHKQTHKSAIDRHIDDCGDRQAPFAIAISPHLLSLSASIAPSCNLNPHFHDIACHTSLLCLKSSITRFFGFHPQCPEQTRSHSFSPSSSSCFLAWGPVREAEKVFALSLPLSGCVLAPL